MISFFAQKALYCFGVGVFALSLTGESSQKPFAMKDWAPDGLRASQLFPNKWFIQTGGAGRKSSKGDVITGYGFRATDDCDQAPLPKARSDGYEMRYPRLHEGDLFPAFGHLYRMGRVSTGKLSRRLFGARQVAEEDIPKGIGLPLRTYVFSLSKGTVKEWQYSGTLHDHYIYVWEIARAHDAKDDKKTLRAKVGVLPKNDDSPHGRAKEIVWKWVRTGDVLQLGEHRHKVVHIVPPIDLKTPEQPHAQLVGWIELDQKPLEKAEKQKPGE